MTLATSAAFHSTVMLSGKSLMIASVDAQSNSNTIQSTHGLSMFFTRLAGTPRTWQLFTSSRLRKEPSFSASPV
jgi:hypothetical protein